LLPLSASIKTDLKYTKPKFYPLFCMDMKFSEYLYLKGGSGGRLEKTAY
jgi:hypothetical protein